MTVKDFYNVTDISEKISIIKIVEENYDVYFKLLYEGSVFELPSYLFEMHVLEIRVSRESFSMILTVE